MDELLKDLIEKLDLKEKFRYNEYSGYKEIHNLVNKRVIRPLCFNYEFRTFYSGFELKDFVQIGPFESKRKCYVKMNFDFGKLILTEYEESPIKMSINLSNILKDEEFQCNPVFGVIQSMTDMDGTLFTSKFHEWFFTLLLDIESGPDSSGTLKVSYEIKRENHSAQVDFIPCLKIASKDWSFGSKFQSSWMLAYVRRPEHRIAFDIYLLDEEERIINKIGVGDHTLKLFANIKRNNDLDGLSDNLIRTAILWESHACSKSSHEDQVRGGDKISRVLKKLILFLESGDFLDFWNPSENVLQKYETNTKYILGRLKNILRVFEVGERGAILCAIFTKDEQQKLRCLDY